MSKQLPHLRRRNRIKGAFAWRLIEMLESPAYRVLSLSAHRVIARLEVELASHAGRDNGKLPVTFDDFQRYGIDRHAIGPAIREAEALGFVHVTERGYGGSAEYRTPNKFELTYRHTQVNASDDWRKIQTIEEADAIACAARTPVKRYRRKQKPSGGKHTDTSGGFPTKNSDSPVGIPPTTASVGFPPLLSRYRGGGHAAAPTVSPDGDGTVRQAARKLRRKVR